MNKTWSLFKIDDTIIQIHKDWKAISKFILLFHLQYRTRTLHLANIELPTKRTFMLWMQMTKEEFLIPQALIKMPQNEHDSILNRNRDENELWVIMVSLKRNRDILIYIHVNVYVYYHNRSAFNIDIIGERMNTKQ